MEETVLFQWYFCLRFSVQLSYLIYIIVMEYLFITYIIDMKERYIYT